MIPRLFDSSATEFTGHGLGVLTDAIDVFAEENSEDGHEWELSFKYPNSGDLVQYLTLENIIVVKANSYQEPQAFRIYSVENSIDQTLEIRAQHISYDLSSIPVKPFKAIGSQKAVTKLLENMFPIGNKDLFTISSNIPAPQIPVVTKEIELDWVPNEAIRNGVFISLNGYSRTGYIYLDSVLSIDILITGNTTYNGAFYDVSQNLISQIEQPATGRHHVFNVPDNAMYVAISVPSTSINNIQVSFVKMEASSALEDQIVLSFEEPKTALSVLLDGDDSIKGKYGGDLVTNNWSISLAELGGEDRGECVEYGIDLIDLDQERELTDMVTGILPYYIREKDIAVDLEPKKVSDSVEVNAPVIINEKAYILKSGNKYTMKFTPENTGGTAHITPESGFPKTSFKMDGKEKKYDIVLGSNVNVPANTNLVVVDSLPNVERDVEELTRKLNTDTEVVDGVEYSYRQSIHKWRVTGQTSNSNNTHNLIEDGNGSPMLVFEAGGKYHFKFQSYPENQVSLLIYAGLSLLLDTNYLNFDNKIVVPSDASSVIIQLKAKPNVTLNSVITLEVYKVEERSQEIGDLSGFSIIQNYLEPILYGDVVEGPGDYNSCPKILPVNLTEYFPDQEIEPTVEEITSKGQEYIAKEEIGIPKVNLTVSYAPFLDHDIHMYDAIRVKFVKIGVDVKSKITRYRYDVLSERCIEIDVGKTKDSALFTLQDASRLRSGLLPPDRIQKNSLSGNKLKRGAVGSGEIGKNAINPSWHMPADSIDHDRLQSNSVGKDNLSKGWHDDPILQSVPENVYGGYSRNVGYLLDPSLGVPPDGLFGWTETDAQGQKHFHSVSEFKDSIPTVGGGSGVGYVLDPNFIFDGSVDASTKIKDESVTTQKIADESVTENKIQPGGLVRAIYMNHDQEAQLAAWLNLYDNVGPEAVDYGGDSYMRVPFLACTQQFLIDGSSSIAFSGEYYPSGAALHFRPQTISVNGHLVVDSHGPYPVYVLATEPVEIWLD